MSLIKDNVSIDSIENIENKKRVKKRKYYPTNRNSYIVNAVSGYKYDFVQGSKHELKLFKVINSTCYYDDNGCFRSKKSTANKTLKIVNIP